MKKHTFFKAILLLTIFPVTALSIRAQAQTDKPVSFGIKLGTNSSGFTHNYEIFSGKKLGVACGAFVEAKPNKMLGVALELNYLQQGAFLPLFLLGTALAYVRERTGSLVPGMVLHCLWNSVVFIAYLTLFG
jgi:hypothetical protein